MVATISKDGLLPLLINSYLAPKSGVTGGFGMDYRNLKNPISAVNMNQNNDCFFYSHFFQHKIW